MSSLRQRIKDGVEGKFQGLANGFDRLNSVIFGIQRRCFMLLGGISGTYKTTLVDFMLLNAIADAQSKGINLHVKYYSYEIDEITKKCNWLSVIINQKYGVEISPEKIKGLGDNRLTYDEQVLVASELDYVEELFKSIDFKFVPSNPTGMYYDVCKYHDSIGKFEYEDYIDEVGETKKKITKYTPNDPDAYTLIIIDHLLLFKRERGFTEKENLDKLSNYIVELRNMFGTSFIGISQFNDGLNSVDRAKFKGVDLSPQITDFKGSRGPYEAADIVIGLLVPYKLDMEKSLGYDINRLRSKMLYLKVIKNRLSKDNVAIGLLAEPKKGSFSELPEPDKIKYSDYE
jgi:hypothetical protein